MFSKPLLQSVSGYLTKHVFIDVLRLDLVHPIVSGNKWYKLKYYLDDARRQNVKKIATFGGAYSNHIVATACAARISGFESFGIIRGEAASHLSHTLQNAMSYGMILHFVSRSEYAHKDAMKNMFKDYFWIEEGGFGAAAAKGAGEILDNVVLNNYTHIITAVGTGSTFAGIINKMLPHQKAIGISVMKNNFELINQIKSLLTNKEQQKDYELLHDFHFGGYAKKNNELIDFMNAVYVQTQIPLDFVYTAKAFYALTKLIEQKTIQQKSRVLFIHTGGLQGNLSLPKKLLLY